MNRNDIISDPNKHKAYAKWVAEQNSACRHGRQRRKCELCELQITLDQVKDLTLKLKEANNVLAYYKSLVTSDQRYEEGQMDEKLNCEAHKKLDSVRKVLEDIKAKCSMQSSALGIYCFVSAVEGLEELE